MNQVIAKWYEDNSSAVTALSDDIWAHPESAFEEFYACQKTAAFLREQGFTDVKEVDAKNQGGTPNCVIARYGSCKPVIGIIGELDALNGIGQEASPEHKPVPGPGHGCGHNLMAAGCAGAAAAVKMAMEEEHLNGTIVYFGCPAEEALAGKVYMAANGWFDDLDLCLAWHPLWTDLQIVDYPWFAQTSLYFTFHGVSAHAATHPHAGRSALDAAELMNVGMQFLREHLPDRVRMHYAFTSAGEKPNIVPDYAQLYYYVRSANTDTNDEIIERLKMCALGAAIMTGTTVDVKMDSVCHDTFLNHRLNQAMYEAALQIPPVEWDEADQAFAETLYRNVTGNDPGDLKLLHTTVRKPVVSANPMPATGSTDVGEVSHIVPTVQIMGLGMIPGLMNHHWSTTACAGTSIGHKAELYAGKCIAQCARNLLEDPKAVEEMWAEFKEAKKSRKPYKAIAGDGTVQHLNYTLSFEE